MKKKKLAAATKKDFIKKLKETVNFDLTNDQTKEIYDAFTKIMKDTISEKERLSMNGFGTFKMSKRKARMGHNPQTKQPMKIKASKTVGFRPCAGFKKEL